MNHISTGERAVRLVTHPTVRTHTLGSYATPTPTPTHSNTHSFADNLTQNRGAFGSHVACVLRRLVRICAHYGSDPLFICCSATIANPATHFSKLLPLPCSGGVESLAVIDSTFDGSPHGERYDSTLLDSTRIYSTPTTLSPLHLTRHL